MTCPYCQNDNPSLFDVDPLRQVVYCNVCSKRQPKAKPKENDADAPRPASARVH